MSIKIIHKGYRFRLYPTKEQEKILLSWEAGLKYLWNISLEQRYMVYNRPKCDKYQSDLSFYSQRKEIQELRNTKTAFHDIPFVCCDEVLQELDNAWQRCFKQGAKKPRFKNKIDNIGIKTRNSKVFSIKNNKLNFPILKNIPIVQHRALEGKQKSCTVKREGNKWFVGITCEIFIEKSESKLDNSIALDCGVVNFIADNEGNIVENPKYFLKSKQQLKKARRKLSKKKKGSKNRIKAILKIQKLHRKVRNQRHDFQHKLSNKYSKEYNKIFVEDLSIASMSKSAKGTIENPGKKVKQKSGLNHSILDSAWGSFVEKLQYKFEWNGGELIKVPPKYTSQTCSMCGFVSKDNRKTQEEFKCIECGFELNADVNAAKNILKKGLTGKVIIKQKKYSLNKIARRKTVNKVGSVS